MTKEEILSRIKADGRHEGGLTFPFKDYGSLARALYPGVGWFFDRREGSYSGDWYMVGKDAEGRYYFFSMGYGSCSSCDWLERTLSRSKTLEDGKESLGEIIDEILKTPVLPDRAAALEHAKKFDWGGGYTISREAIEAIERS